MNINEKIEKLFNNIAHLNCFVQNVFENILKNHKWRVGRTPRVTCFWLEHSHNTGCGNEFHIGKTVSLGVKSGNEILLADGVLIHNGDVEVIVVDQISEHAGGLQHAIKPLMHNALASNVGMSGCESHGYVLAILGDGVQEIVCLFHTVYLFHVLELPV